MLPTNQIHNMAQNYYIFCEYAGITTEDSGLTIYDNPIVKGKVRWSYVAHMGEMAGTYNKGVDGLHAQIFNLELDNSLGIGVDYVTRKRSTDDKFGIVGRYDFERWLNDQLLKLNNNNQ